LTTTGILHIKGVGGTVVQKSSNKPEKTHFPNLLKKTKTAFLGNNIGQQKAIFNVRGWGKAKCRGVGRL